MSYMIHIVLIKTMILPKPPFPSGAISFVNQGNRVKDSCCDEACEEVVVPSGGFALESLGVLSRRLSDEIVRHVL
jgi:hypothetical protein